MEKTYKILIADRNRNVCRLLQRELEPEGYRILVARDGKDLLMTINTDESPDLLVMDLDLPLVDPAELLEKLKNRIPPLPVIIHSCLANVSSESMLENAHAFVDKGENLEVLKDVIAEVLKAKRGKSSLNH